MQSRISVVVLVVVTTSSIKQHLYHARATQLGRWYKRMGSSVVQMIEVGISMRHKNFQLRSLESQVSKCHGPLIAVGNRAYAVANSVFVRIINPGRFIRGQSL
jgi:hypothetical protein